MKVHHHGATAFDPDPSMWRPRPVLGMVRGVTAGRGLKGLGANEGANDHLNDAHREGQRDEVSG